VIDIFYHPQTAVENIDYFQVNHVPMIQPEFKVNDISVWCDGEMYGGGQQFGQEYVPVLQTLYPGKKFQNCLEWCSGPGFIGFALLANNLIQDLCLMDVFKPALLACEATIANLPTRYKSNHIETLHLNCVADIPEDKKFDLIVANPPHWNWEIPPYTANFFSSRINADNEWHIHGEFFSNIKKNLAPHGVILLQEAAKASGPETFRQMIEHSGLKITRCFHTQEYMQYWYLEVTHTDKE
jgi:methylase of polypeptide subunit release factors